MTPRLPRALPRAAFIAYAVVLAYATHKPNLVIDGPIERTDLVVHIGAFGVWTLLLIATQWTGPWHSAAALLRAGGIGLVYAAVDESTQAIPAINRVFGVDDMLANFAGVASAVLAVRLLQLGARAGRTDAAAATDR